MEDQLGAALILTVIFGFIFAIIYIGIRRKERMALLEKGVDASFFISKQTNTITLKLGMLFVGIAVGVILGEVLYVNSHMHESVSYFSMIFLFGGLSLIINYFIERKGVKE